MFDGTNLTLISDVDQDTLDQFESLTISRRNDITVGEFDFFFCVYVYRMLIVLLHNTFILVVHILFVSKYFKCIRTKRSKAGN